MQITINIKDSEVKDAISEALHNNIYGNWDDVVLKVAGVPAKSKMIKALFTDAKFMAAFTKRIIDNLDPCDSLWDAVYDVNMPGVDALNKACEKVASDMDKDIKLQREADQLKRTIEVLKKAGYKVEKA